MHICSWIRQVYPELCFPAAIATLLIKQRKGMQEFISQKFTEKEEETQEEGRQPEGQEE